jgi:polyisoprenyl-teichoic acid--peptidoglycan teichoic acid transferase
MDKKGPFGWFKKQNRPLRITIVFLISLLIAAGALSAVFFSYVDWVNRTINPVTATEIESILEPVETSTDPVTILLLGRDSRDADGDPGRADSIMLLYLDPDGQRASLLSIPRDTLVDIPGRGQDKVNAAYSFGQEDLMIETVSNFLDARINHFVAIDFEGFIKLIDELGGVEISIDRPLIDPKSGANFSAGVHNFTGEQALAYTRSRSTELGDIGRIQRQQHLFFEMVSQKLNVRYLSRVPYYFNILFENTTTDLDLLTILRYSKAALSLDFKNIETAIIPTHPDWIDDGAISVQVPDTEEAKKMWQRIIKGEPASRYNALYFEPPDMLPETLGTSMEFTFDIKVKNTGALVWEKDSENPVYLSYHWIDFEDRKMALFDGKRSAMPVDEMRPGEEQVFSLDVSTPKEGGQYILQIDMVHEGLTWFSYQGVPTLEKFVTLDIAYSAEYSDKSSTPKSLELGESFKARLSLKNTGFMEWVHDIGRGRTALGTHWINRDTREVVVWDGPRALLPSTVKHGEQVEVAIEVEAPQRPGRYILQYDMVHEGYSWFSEKGVIPFEVNVDVGQAMDPAMIRDTTVKVYNGNGIPGSANLLIDFLRSYGFSMASPSNAHSFAFEQTIIIYRSDKLEKAQQMAIVLESYIMEEYSGKWSYYDTGADVVVIVGADYEKNLR